jgi:hypothetical protein
MGLLFRDRFNRVAGSLGADWNERPAQTVSGQSIGTCNMSCDGDFARIDTTPTFHIATANASNGQTTHYVECWCFAKTNNNAGLVLRFQDAANMYFLFPDPAGSPTVRIHRRRLGVQTLNVATGGTVIANNWNLISIIMTGNRIQLWLNGTYDTAREGPVIDFADGTPVAGAGACGIMSSGNNATGAAGPQWNDFRLNDNARGQVIYVTSTGTSGYGDGEVDAPMPGIMHGLNNCGCIAGSTLKFADAGPYTNSAVTLRHEIGHAGKFDIPGFVFPTYSDDTGAVLDPGSPNLLIEGADGATRTLCRETQGTVPFWSLRAGSRGIVFRGLNSEALSVNRFIYTVSSALPIDHSFSVDKCHIKVGPSGGAVPIAVQAPCTAVRMVYTWVEIPSPLNLNTDIVDFLTNASVRSSLFRMVLIDGSCDFGINYTQLMSTWQSGDVHDCDHITFRTTDQAARTKAAVAILQPTLIVAGSRLTIQNTITFIQGPEGVGSSGFGVYFGNTNSPGGTMEEHHNGFDGLALDACTGPAGNTSTNHVATVCNIAAATPALDPGFRNPAGTFTWLHTGGASLNGEGAFAALVVPDLRVSNLGEYKDAADDATVLQLLDKGALQDYAVPSVPAVGSDVPVETENVYCVSVVFDPGGEQEYDLSSLLKAARPIRQEKDVLVRRYRANDVELTFADPDELFVETNPLSFLINPSSGEPEWIYKRVEIVTQIGTLPLLRFVGFVLDIDVARGEARMRIANRFQALTDRPVRANTLGKLVSTTGATGIGPATDLSSIQAPATGTFLGDVDNLFDWQAGFNNPPAQTFTVTFHDGGSLSTFSISGSVSGFEGSGQLGVPFSWVSATGYLAINTDVGGSFVVDPPGPAKGSTCTTEVLWRPIPNSTIIEAFLEFLASPQGADLEPDEIALETFTAIQGTVADQVLPNIGAPANTPRMAAVEGNVLDALTSFARHCGCVLIETSQAALGISSFMPRIVTGIREVCNSVDLMRAEVTHLPVYNEFTIEHTFEERTQRYSGGRIWPPAAENDSFQRTGRRLPAPESLAFRGYDSSNAFFCEAVAQSLYLRHRIPAPVIPVTLTVDYLDAELIDTYRVNSLVPTMVIPFTDPSVIEKNILVPLTVYAELVRTDNVDSDECGGYLALDDPNKGLDDPCWGLF